MIALPAPLSRDSKFSNKSSYGLPVSPFDNRLKPYRTLLSKLDAETFVLSAGLKYFVT
jgi:hypothetical protein